MPLRTSPGNSCRFEGCTLTGALSVTTAVRDSASIVHGPAGCAHHNFSLLHTIALDQDAMSFPCIVSSGMLDTEVVFGGEDALHAAIRSAVAQGVSSIHVLSTCIAETIGDDVAAVCNRDWDVPVIRVPTAGFLGGSFQKGVNNALAAIAATAPPSDRTGPLRRVNVIGEKNLEYEVEENYAEVARLLSLLGLSVNLRFVRYITVADVDRLKDASLNILREKGMEQTGNELAARFHTPYLDSFPSGLSSTTGFLVNAGVLCGVDYQEAVARELEYQQGALSRFSDLSGRCISLPPSGCGDTVASAVREVAGLLGITIGPHGTRVPVPYEPPVGTGGVVRMLHRWRRALHA